MDYFFALITGFALGVAARSLIAFGWAAVGFILLLAFVSFVIWLAARERWLAFAAVALVFIALGAGRVLLAPQAIAPAFAPLIDTKVSLTGTIIADPDVRETNQHLVIRTEREGQRADILAFAPLYPAFVYGEQVKVFGTLEKPEPFDTDGGRVFRYDQYLEKDGIFAIISQAHVESTGLPTGLLTRVMGALYGVKHAFVRGIDAALPEPSAALAEGLLTGGKQGLGKALLAAFTVSGLVQIVVLSGYNVMIVAEGIMRSLAFLPRRFALSAAAFGIIGFILAAGSGSSAVRAGVMACLALYARAGGRTYDALRALCVALFLMLLWNPFYLVFDPGFQLSAVATLGLIIGTPIIEPYLIRIKYPALREVIATTLAAQAAVLPLLLYQTGNLSFVSVPANVLVSLLVPVAMAASFVAGLAGLIAPFIAPALGIPAYLLLSAIVDIASGSAALPLARVVLPAFPFAVVVLLYSGLWLFVRKLKQRPYRIALRTRSN